MKNLLGRYSIFLLMIALNTLLLISFSWAAKPIPNPDGTGTLTGKVTVAGTNSPISSATINAVGLQATYTGTTDGSGVYKLTLPSGDYNVTASAPGYSSQTFSARIREGRKTVLKFALSESVSMLGTLSGTVKDSGNSPIAGALLVTNSGSYSSTTNDNGIYIIDLAAGVYALTVSAKGYQTQIQEGISVVASATTTANFTLVQESTGPAITSLIATPTKFLEASITTITLNATVDGDVSSFEWTQIEGPKVPLTFTSVFSASAEVDKLEVAAECDLVFELMVADSSGTETFAHVTVSVAPTDIEQYPAPNQQIGGSTTSTARFSDGGTEWSLFNIGTKLIATPISLTKGTTYDLFLPGAANDIEIVDYNDQKYALIAAGKAGIVVVNITNPTSMQIVSTLPVNFLMENVTFTETGGAILYGNTFSTTSSLIASLASDGTDLYIANHDYGIQKTALTNVFGKVVEQDGTLQIDVEVCTIQYAGEHGWGGPVHLMLFEGKLFAGLGTLGMGIFDSETLKQIGRYNLYTDEEFMEDYFGAMAISQSVGSDPVTGDLYLDDFTGMPDYRQASYELTEIMRGTNVTEPTPWADMERQGKWYYEAVSVDIAQQNERTIAYIAYSLGGVFAIDITGFDSLSETGFIEGQRIAYFPAVPANGPYDTSSDPSSLLPYEGAGKLKEAGVNDIKVLGDLVFLTDHFAGLVVLENAASPEMWCDETSSYDNDTDGIAGNNVPEYENITSFNMSAWDPNDNESLPWAYYLTPCRLATRELNGHGYALDLMDDMNVYASGQVDILECSSAGGFVFVDLINLDAELMEGRFSIVVYFPSTDEIGVAADGSATQTIALGHTDSIAATRDYIYISDGPHGVTAWKITDDDGYPTDSVHLVANTLQDEYPEEIDGELIYPASHTVRNVLDPNGDYVWSLCVGNGLRRVPILDVEIGVGQVGEPLLMQLSMDDSYEHNADWGVVKQFNYQDQAYDVEFLGNYAFVADGSNGLTVYDISKNSTDPHSGFFVGNIGYNQGQHLLGTASGVDLWDYLNPENNEYKRYAIIASGPYGVGVVDVTDINAMQIVKVFEPIKYENDELGSADGQAIDVEVIGDKAYFTYDSFGVLCYDMADLINPVPAGVDPTELFKKELDGTILYDYRPEFISRFKLQSVSGYEDVIGGAVKMAYTEQAGELFFYVAFGEAGVVKVDYTDPTNPVLVDIKDTASECVDVEIANGRLYVGDHGGGLVLFK